MPSIITIKNIEETINSLNYRSETTLKSKLIRAVRNYYTDENSIESLTTINIEELVKFIWDTGDDSALIKNKKKNFSSVKSSVNSDLKKLYQQGNNPQGIIINHNNVFDISDEAKNKALSDIADIIREKDDTGGRIRTKKQGKAEGTGDRVLADIVDILQDKENGFQNKLGKITDIIQGILSEAISRTGTQLAGAEAEQIKKLFSDLPAQLKESAKGGTGADDDSAGTTDVSNVQSTGVNPIINSVDEMLTDALAVNASGLNEVDSERIKNLFGQLAGKIKSALGEGRSLDDIGVEAAWEGKGNEITLTGDEECIEELVDVIEEPGIDQTSIEIGETSEEVLGGAEEIAEEIEEVLEDDLIDTVSDIDANVEEFAPENVIEDAPLTTDIEDINLSPEDLENVEIITTVDEVAGDASGSITTEEIKSEAVPGETSAIDNGITENESLTPEEVLTEEHPDEISEDVVYEEITGTGQDPDDAIFSEELPDESFSGEFDTREPEIDDDVVEFADDSTEIIAGDQEDIEIVEENVGEEIQEIIEESVEGTDEVSIHQEEIAGAAADEDLQSKADILTELASAAKVLEKIGPDLTSSIYSEEEIKQKAKLLSEEFDSYLSMRERFYNQHILIRSGNYPIGSNEDKKGLSANIVNLREFYIGKFPVTNALFEIFVEQTGYITTAERLGFGMVYIPRMQKAKNLITGTESFIWNSQLQYKRVPGACWYRPSGPASTLHIKRTHPVVQVSLEDACAFAAWTGKRIPTEAEWEAATRTSYGYLYPWGNDWQDDACNLEKSLQGDTTPVDQYIKFANNYEVVDSLGNVLEWTLDPWSKSGDSEEGDEACVVKGASWISDCPATLTSRQPVYKDSSSNILGFRCIAI